MARDAGRTERKRIQIRDAAKVLFLERGFSGTSTDAILAASGIASKETLYRYYPSKEELFVDVLRALTLDQSYLRQFAEQPSEPKSTGELRSLLHAFVSRVLDTMLQPEYLALMRTTLAELPRFPQLGAMFRRSVPEKAMTLLETLLRNAQSSGLVPREKKLETVIRVILGTLLSFAIFDGLFAPGGPTATPRPPRTESIDDIVENLMIVATSTGSTQKGVRDEHR